MFKKYFIIIIALVICIYGLVTINIYNTKALSPLGNTEDNFEMVSSEFGEDFSEFIKDKSPVKIYLDQTTNSEAKVNIYGSTINLTKNNPFLKGIKPVFNFIKNSFNQLVDKFNKNTENSNEEINNSNSNSDLQNIVDDFIQTEDNTNNN